MLVPETKPNSRQRGPVRRAACRSKRAACIHLAPRARAPSRASRPTRSKMKRSKLEALEMSIDGLLVWQRLGRGARAVDAGAEEFVEHVVLVGGEDQLARSAGPSCARCGRRRCCRSCRRARENATCSSLDLRRREIALEVIHDLRRHARPVDRIDRADLVLAP